jgi:Zn-dependent peptidase ImmA (M78 family)
MRFLNQKLSKLNFGWNEKPLTERDFYGLCRRFRIQVTEMPLRTDGFYYRVLGRDYIAVNSRLSQPVKLLVLFHELGHFLFHTPESGATANFHGVGGSARKEREADAFALCSLLPLRMIATRSLHELTDETGLPEKAIADRFQIWHKYGL